MDCSLNGFISPKSNDELSKMNILDRSEFIKRTNEYYLELRDRLSIPRSVTFGAEIEFEYPILSKYMNEHFDYSDKSYHEYAIEMFMMIEDELKKKGLVHENDQNKFKLIDEPSMDMGYELVSPILRNNLKTWASIKKATDVIKSYLCFSDNASSHVHIGAGILNDNINYWIRFIKLWSAYEDIIMRFAYGEFLTERKRLIEYAVPCAKDLLDTIKMAYYDDITSEELLYTITGDLNRNLSVNFLRVLLPVEKETFVGNTIEFRCPNGTLNPIIWQNNINLFANMLLSVKNDSFKEDIVDKRLNSDVSWMEDLVYYRQIDVLKALEFADIVFSNNLDKLYFMRQYLKSMEIGKKCLEKAKIFTL